MAVEIKNECPIVIVSQYSISKARVKQVLDVEDDNIEIVQVGGSDSKTAIVHVGENVSIIGSARYVLTTEYDNNSQINRDTFVCPRASMPGLLFWTDLGA